MLQTRQQQLIEVYRIINDANIEELANIVEEIRCCHDNLMTFNQETKLFAKVESVSINGDAIQLNIEKSE